MTIFLIFSFILGTIIGSFLNVIIYRLNTGMTLGGRSKCFTCNKTLTWVELFPILSFLAQRGVCRKCKSRISWQYPLVEIGSGTLFILVFYFFPPISIGASIDTVFYLLITSLLIIMTVYDIKHKIIPDSLVYTFDILALFHLFIGSRPSILALIAGPLLALPFAALWYFSKGKWMGFGDAKLVLGIGWTLGFVAGLSAITLAFWIGAVVSILWMVAVFRKFKAYHEIPFGPYLVLGMYIVLFFNISVFDPALFDPAFISSLFT